MSAVTKLRGDVKRKHVHRLAVLAIGVAALQIVSNPVLARAGALDTSFDGDGKLTATWSAGGSSSANAVVATDVAKIMVAGEAGGQFVVARYHSHGPLHTGWGGTGKVVTSFPGGSSAHAIALQPDGKVIAAGEANGDFAVVRYNYDGSLDNSFGVGGKVTTDIGGRVDIAYAVALAPDGKIIAAGSAVSSINRPHVAIARYNANGSLDASFGLQGKVVSEEGLALAARIQPDGKVVVGGVYLCTPSTLGCHGSIATPFALARFNQNGSPDVGFRNPDVASPPGFSIHSFDLPGTTGSHVFPGLALTADGKILAGGYVNAMNTADFVSARINADGSLDSTFGTGGVTRVDVGGIDLPTSMTVQGDGRIVLAGRSTVAGDSDFASARLNSNGTVDASYGNGGSLRTDFGSAYDVANAVAIQPVDGRILLAGTVARVTTTDIAVLRYHVS